MPRNRIALLGAGRMARVHAATIRSAGAELATVFDVVTAAAREVADQYGADACDSAEAAIDREDIHGVLIATPSDTHVRYLLGAVGAGKAVLCEKPLASTFAETRQCIEALGAGADRVFLAFNRRFDPGHAGVHESVRRGDIGRLEQLTITSRDPAPPPLDYIPHSGGLFRDMAIHDFDMARWLMGEEPVRLFAHGSSLVDERIGRLGDIDTAVVTLHTASGRQAVILNSRRAAYGFDQRIEAFGSDGMTLSENTPRTGVRRFGRDVAGAPAPFRGFFMERYGESYRLELEAFLECVARGEPMPVNALDGFHASYLAEAATESLQRGQPIDLDPEGGVAWQ